MLARSPAPPQAGSAGAMKVEKYLGKASLPFRTGVAKILPPGTTQARYVPARAGILFSRNHATNTILAPTFSAHSFFDVACGGPAAW